VGQIVAGLRGQGTAVVSITHLMSEAAVADRVVVLHEGLVALAGPPRDVFGRADLLQEIGLGLPPVLSLAIHLRRVIPSFPTGMLTMDELVGAVAAQARSRR
jgi:hypothetical protein